jgi:hypothetical protein
MKTRDISSPARVVVRAVGVDHGGVWGYVRLRHLLHGDTGVAGLGSEDAQHAHLLQDPRQQSWRRAWAPLRPRSDVSSPHARRRHEPVQLPAGLPRCHHEQAAQRSFTTDLAHVLLHRRCTRGLELDQQHEPPEARRRSEARKCGCQKAGGPRPGWPPPSSVTGTYYGHLAAHTHLTLTLTRPRKHQRATHTWNTHRGLFISNRDRLV